MSKEAKKEKVKEHTCGEKCEIYSRCCGYYRPIQNWNLGKKEEFRDRKTFNVKPCASK